jgi:uncharacterized membrane protein
MILKILYKNMNNKEIKSTDTKNVSLQLMQQSFSGPLPHPDILNKYEQISAGAADRIIKMAEDQSAHRRKLESKMIDSDTDRAKWGQILGFLISVFGLTISGLIAIFGNAIAGSVIGVGTLASLVGVFMYGNKIKQEKLSEIKNNSDK